MTGRPKERTVKLDPDVVNGLRQLFGTIQNAYNRLGLDIDIPFNTFYRAMQHYTISGVHAEAINDRWLKWKELYLHPDVPDNCDLTVHPFDLHLEPEWKANPDTR